MEKQIMKTATHSIMISLLLLGATAFADISGSLSDECITGYQALGSTETYTLCYSIDITGETSGKADVLFLTDTTGSMGGYIAGIRSAFSGILDAIDVSLPGLDIEYAVADYRNYTDGGNYTAYGVNLRRSFTADTTSVHDAINGLSAGGGADGPESQLKAMVNLANNWLTSSGPLGFGGRAAAQKIVIWAGDWPGHIAGDEPCSSGTPPAGYYPTLAGTISALNAQGLLVFGLNTYGSGSGINTPYGGSCSPGPAVQQQDAITLATGGMSFYNVGSGGPSIEDAIVASITGGVEILSNITLSLSGDDGDFVVVPWSQTITGAWTSDDSPVTGCFDFDATAPLSEGTANFEMVLLGNGAELDRACVSLTTTILVAVDIKPTSCPNPLNVDSKGVLPVAIVGTQDFDVTQVDPGTVKLIGVEPLRCSYEDVCTPYYPFSGKETELSCTEAGSDGFLDLTLKFDMQQVIEALGEVADQDVLVLSLEGKLFDEYGGVPIAGQDVVRILKKGSNNEHIGTW